MRRGSDGIRLRRSRPPGPTRAVAGRRSAPRAGTHLPGRRGLVIQRGRAARRWSRSRTPASVDGACRRRPRAGPAHPRAYATAVAQPVLLPVRPPRLLASSVLLPIVRPLAWAGLPAGDRAPLDRIARWFHRHVDEPAGGGWPDHAHLVWVRRM